MKTAERHYKMNLSNYCENWTYIEIITHLRYFLKVERSVFDKQVMCSYLFFHEINIVDSQNHKHIMYLMFRSNLTDARIHTRWSGGMKSKFHSNLSVPAFLVQRCQPICTIEKSRSAQKQVYLLFACSNLMSTSPKWCFTMIDFAQIWLWLW